MITVIQNNFDILPNPRNMNIRRVISLSPLEGSGKRIVLWGGGTFF